MRTPPILRQFAAADIFVTCRRVVDGRHCLVFTEDDAAGVVALDRREVLEMIAELQAIANEL